MAEKDERFQEINAERLNIVDADGRVRMTLANALRLPDAVIDGRSIPGRAATDETAGVIFYNEDGDECGGLVFTNRGAFLGFDQYKQDQIVGLTYEESEVGGRQYGLFVNDQPDANLWESDGRNMHIPRLFAGRDREGSVSITLRDSNGRDRIRVKVDAEDQPRMEILNDEREVVSRMSLEPSE